VTPEQGTALTHHCRLAFETAHPRFAHLKARYSLVLTVNSGYE
jgi:hypothetical protein